MSKVPEFEMVTAGKVVSVAYEMMTVEGEMIHTTTSEDPLVYLHGAGNILRGLEEGLDGRVPGETFRLELPPEKAFGDMDPARVQFAERSAFPPDADIQIGMQFQAQDSGGNVIPVWVTDIAGDRVTINGNHPLAGVTLKYEITVVSLREATAEEQEHGHAHGSGGHSH